MAFEPPRGGRGTSAVPQGVGAATDMWKGRCLHRRAGCPANPWCSLGASQGKQAGLPKRAGAVGLGGSPSAAMLPRPLVPARPYGIPMSLRRALLTVVLTSTSLLTACALRPTYEALLKENPLVEVVLPKGVKTYRLQLAPSGEAPAAPVETAPQAPAAPEPAPATETPASDAPAATTPEAAPSPVQQPAATPAPTPTPGT